MGFGEGTPRLIFGVAVTRHSDVAAQWMKETWEGIKKVWVLVVALFVVLGGIVATFVAIYTVTGWVENTARNAVLNESFLESLANQVRLPMVVFNSSGAVEAELGAEEYIDTKNIKIEPVPDLFGFKITLHGKRLLPKPPLVSSLDVNLYPKKIEAGKGYDWNISWFHEAQVKAY